ATAPSPRYPLSLHDALPISVATPAPVSDTGRPEQAAAAPPPAPVDAAGDRRALAAAPPVPPPAASDPRPWIQAVTPPPPPPPGRSEEHTSELQSRSDPASRL